ncbi:MULTISPECIES: hypothetical protein [unclassified Spirosoma]|uniref:hypothetical protein n=1 Tax=unclassified Spirosoma TaxID=2621999 RepID=UPI00095D8AF9|nr:MULTISPECIES: hypothetical protein [unclassified Spirosoma]MBN8824361.1 hypothetical protein [Spirosoma sp.]OJW70175.1 MAG: hypothetical protein BGO59_26235 [Spirosoma sp. 48-14]
MKAFNIFFLAAAATFILTAASYKLPSHSKSLAFVGKNLSMTSFQVSPAIDLDGDGDVDNDLMSFLRPCDKDNTLTFESTGKVSGHTGTLTCSSNESLPVVAKPSHWTYNEKTATLRIVNDKDTSAVSEWKVLEASAAGLKIEKTATEYNQKSTTTVTLKSAVTQ